MVWTDLTRKQYWTTRIGHTTQVNHPDIEQFYQIMIQECEQYGEIPQSNNAMDLLFLKHLHLLTTIMLDHSHITELLEEMHKKTQDLSFLIDQAHTLTIRMKLVTNWMERLYQNGAEPVNFTTEQSSHIDHLLGCIESRDNSRTNLIWQRYGCSLWQTVSTPISFLAWLVHNICIASTFLYP